MINLHRTGAFLTAFACAALLVGSCATASPAADAASIANTIKADVAEMVAGINAHDIDRTTQFDAPDIVSMESGRPPSFGAAADREGLSMAFHYAPDWRLQMIDETVDVSSAGDMAIYRGTYNESSVDHGAAMTHKVNFVAGFKHQANGSWKIAWSVVCAQERSHPA